MQWSWKQLSGTERNYGIIIFSLKKAYTDTTEFALLWNTVYGSSDIHCRIIANSNPGAVADSHWADHQHWTWSDMYGHYGTSNMNFPGQLITGSSSSEINYSWELSCNVETNAVKLTLSDK